MYLTPRMGVRRSILAALTSLLFTSADAGAGIYRWQDGSGTTHYGDSPPTGANNLAELKPTPYDSYGLVATVIDGDTLILADGRRLRLLGIDAPEVAHHKLPGEPLGEKARKFLKTQVEGRRVQLRYDVQREDRYNRLLVHLYLEDAHNINALLLRKGLAHARFEWPNMQYAERYYEIEKMARDQGSGIWSLPSFRVKPMKHLETLRNRFIRLRGRVSRIEKKQRYSYLLFDGKLRAGIKNSRLALFREKGLEIDMLAKHSLVLRGWLSVRRGVPYLELSHPFQIEKVD